MRQPRYRAGPISKGEGLIDRSPLSPGDRFGDWVIESRLGAGGTGEVYCVRQVAGGPPRALKVLRTTPPQGSAAAGRLRREIRLLSNLKHPRIASLLGLVHCAGRVATLGELVRGTSLRALFDGPSPGGTPPGPATPLRRGLSISEVLRLTRDIAEGLAFLHREGVLHRDLKPSNVMIEPRGRARLVDFGLARMLDEATLVSRTGQVLTTLIYTPPEVLLRRPVGPAADLYTLGVILYEMLVGTPPFVARAPARLAIAHLRETPPPPSASTRGLSLWWDRITDRLLRKAPAERYSSAEALLGDLSALEPDLF